MKLIYEDTLIKKFLRENDFINIKDNIIHMEKAFITASILTHGIRLKKKNKITDKQFKAYFEFVKSFQLGKIDLFWKDNKIKYITIKEKDDDFEIQSKEENNEPEPPKAA